MIYGKISSKMVVKRVHFVIVCTSIALSIVIENKDALVISNVLRPSLLRRDSLFGERIATLNGGVCARRLCL